jgi:hypothetical protein
VEYQSERISSGALIKGNKKGGRCVTERLLLSLGLGRRTQWTSPLLDPRRRRPHHLLQQRRRRPCQHTIESSSDGRLQRQSAPPSLPCAAITSLAGGGCCCCDFFPSHQRVRERRNRRRRPNRGKCSGSVHRADHRASPFTISRSLSCHRWHLVTSHLPIVTSNLF